MRAIEIIKVNVFKNSQIQFMKGMVRISISFLKFEKLEKSFSDGIVIRMTLF